MIVIRGQEFDFNPLNANHIERLEQAQLQFASWDEAEKLRVQQEHCGIAGQIRGQCKLMMRYLDTVLGEGACTRMELDGNDLDACSAAFSDLEKACSAAYSAATARMTPVPNRAHRRCKHRRHG